jgi:GNAT superfamily N-acetyltransferase
MTSAHLSLQPVQASDFDEMLALRIAALRPSLERLGRFDPARARERLAAGFAPQHMQHITQDGQRIGFVTVHPEGADVLRLEHLYLQPGHQGQGVGAWVLRGVQDRARDAGLSLKVSALKLSDANRFYQRHGFEPDGDGEWDHHYRWSPVTEAP